MQALWDNINNFKTNANTNKQEKRNLNTSDWFLSVLFQFYACG